MPLKTRDLHKLLQERIPEAIHVGSEANITGVVKSHPRQPYQNMTSEGTTDGRFDIF